MNTGNAAMRNVVAPPKPPNLVSTSERIDSSVAYDGVVDVSEQEAEAGVATDRKDTRQHGHEEDGVSKVASSADMDRKGVSVIAKFDGTTDDVDGQEVSASEKFDAIAAGEEISTKFDVTTDNVDGQEVGVREKLDGSTDGTKLSVKFDGTTDDVDGQEVRASKKFDGSADGEETSAKFDGTTDNVDGQEVGVREELDGSTDGTNLSVKFDGTTDDVDGQEVSASKKFDGSADGEETSAKFDGTTDNVDGQEVGVREELDGSTDGTKLSAKFDGTTDDVDGQEVSASEKFDAIADGEETSTKFDVTTDNVDGQEERVKTKLNIHNMNNSLRVIVNGDKGNPLFAVGYSFTKPSKEKKKIMKCHKRKGKAKIGRYQRPGNTRKRKVYISLPSVVEVRNDDEGTVSSISTETGRTRHSFHRGLLRSKKLVKSLTDDNQKKTQTIHVLKKKIDSLNQEFVREKRAANTVIAASKVEGEKLMATAESLIEKLDRRKSCSEEMKSKENLESLKRVRRERVKSSQKVRRVKEALSKEKQEKMELKETLQSLKEEQLAMASNIKKLTKNLSTEVSARRKLEAKIKITNDQYLNERDKCNNERRKRRATVGQCIEKLQEKKGEITDLNEALFEMADENKQMRSQMYHALKGKKNVEKVLKRTSDGLAKALQKNTELRNSLEEDACESIKKETELLGIKRESLVGRKGGGHRWPVRVVQLICELLVDGAPPSAIPRIIYTTTTTMTNTEPQQIPSINFVRGCRIIAQIIGETIAGIKLARIESWEQLFTDGTSRRQVSFQNIIIGLLTDETKTLDPLYVSSCIFTENETSEKQVEGIIEKINVLKKRITRLRYVVNREFPNYVHSLPTPDEIDIAKLGNGGAITTDTCNAALKTRRILASKIGGQVHEMDCMHHLRNVQLKGVEKALTAYLNTYLKDTIENIDPSLRVSSSMSSLIRAFDKEFSLCANYRKGHGMLFNEWMKENHAGELLLHVERAGGSRHDLFLEGAPAIFWNRVYCIEFLDERLRLNKEGNILQENLFIILSSLEMVALARACSILYLSICLPFRWIAAKTHTLKEYKWGARSMGRIFDILETKLEEIKNESALFVNRDYMMGLFEDVVYEVPPFKEYLGHMYEKRQMPTVGVSNTKEVHLALLRNELFYPSIEDNQDSTDLVKELAVVAAKAYLDELHDQKKASYKYLSSSHSPFSYAHCPDEIKEEMLGKMATNDQAESSFGAVTNQMQKFTRIDIAGAAAISDLQRNKFLNRVGKKGLFHEFSDEIQISLVLTAMEDAPSTRKENRMLLSRQCKAKRLKEEITKEKGLQKATEEYIDAIYYFNMYNSSACWKSATEVNRGLRQLQTKKDKYESIKENINIRVKGFGWTQFRQSWSKNGKQHSIEFLAEKLKDIIKQGKKLGIPDKPPINIPKRKTLPTLGKQTVVVENLDKNYIKDEEGFVRNADTIRKEREDMGLGSMYYEMQPRSKPKIDDTFVGKRIEVLFMFDILDRDEPEQALRWCQGTVVRVLKNKKVPTVEVLWDPIEESNSGAYQTCVELRDRKWNPKTDSEGAWRLEVIIED